MTTRRYYWIVLLVAGLILFCVGILGVAARDGVVFVVWFAFSALFLAGAFVLRRRPLDELPEVAAPQIRTRDVVVFELENREAMAVEAWIRETDLNELPSAHPAVKQALTDLFGTLEMDTRIDWDDPSSEKAVEIRLWDQDAIVIYDWLRDEAFAEAHDGRLAELHDALEKNTALRLTTTPGTVDAARALVARDMGW